MGEGRRERSQELQIGQQVSGGGCQGERGVAGGEPGSSTVGRGWDEVG